jgi:hypothetical protein
MTNNLRKAVAQDRDRARRVTHRRQHSRRGASTRTTRRPRASVRSRAR